LFFLRLSCGILTAPLLVSVIDKQRFDLPQKILGA